MTSANTSVRSFRSFGFKTTRYVQQTQIYSNRSERTFSEASGTTRYVHPKKVASLSVAELQAQEHAIRLHKQTIHKMSNPKELDESVQEGPRATHISYVCAQTKLPLHNAQVASSGARRFHPGRRRVSRLSRDCRRVRVGPCVMRRLASSCLRWMSFT